MTGHLDRDLTPEQADALRRINVGMGGGVNFPTVALLERLGYVRRYWHGAELSPAGLEALDRHDGVSGR